MIEKHRIFIIILLISTIGCAHSSFMDIITPYKTRLVREYLQKGKQYEANNDYVSALRFYKLAMPVKPSNKEAIEGRKRMEKALYDSAEKHYRTGLKLNKDGQYGQARQQFLMALSLWPDHPESAKILTTRKRIRIKRYILHSIKSEESLSKISERYYGDQNKFPIIARYNNLIDATRLYVGQEIKVPEIEGLKFLAGRNTIETESTESGYQAFSALENPWKEAVDALLEKEEKERAERITGYREQGIRLYQNSKYQEAIDEFNKVLAITHDDRDSIEYIHKSHYELAMNLFKNKDYLAAKDQFGTSIRYKDDCVTCLEYIQKSEELYKELHYKKGMEYYQKEQLIEAINEWELVIALDPDYKKAGYHINKAEVMLSKLEELKKSQEEEGKKSPPPQ